MIAVIVFIILNVISYCLGCLSTAKFLAKSYKSMNIYKVGSGHPDTLNIYNNIDKPLGIFVGIVDFGKVFFYLLLLKYLLGLSYVQAWIGNDLSSENHLLVLGFMMVVGHCLPITNRFHGGRGFFTYIGFVTFFAPWPMIIVALLALFIVVFFQQIRFAQYMIVLLPPFVAFFFAPDLSLIGKMFIAAALMAVINFIVSKKKGEI